jgi:hypothetical protein
MFFTFFPVYEYEIKQCILWFLISKAYVFE